MSSGRDCTESRHSIGGVNSHTEYVLCPQICRSEPWPLVSPCWKWEPSKRWLSEVTRVGDSIAIELLDSTRKENPIVLHALGGYRRRQPPTVLEGDLFQSFTLPGPSLLSLPAMRGLVSVIQVISRQHCLAARWTSEAFTFQWLYHCPRGNACLWRACVLVRHFKNNTIYNPEVWA